KPYTGEKSLGALAAQPLIPFATFFYGEYTQADWSARHIPESLQKIDEHFSLEEKVWTKLQRIPPAQQQMILSYIEFLLSQVNQKSQDSNLNKQQMFVETCGAWQDEPLTAEDLVKTVYSDRTISSQEYSL
ncbi:MAG: DUF2281 domain-containing protein, partial [Symploca sp. SIO1A3]|nr:DUF2281 domain-containing protein [Symploca sp. SIO1A3]